MKRKKVYIIWISAAVLAGVLGLGFYIVRWEQREPLLEVYFFHLNRGRAIFIRTPEGKTILIDGGQNTDVIRELTKVFPFYKRRIDMVIVTSATAKNAGGLAEVVERYEVGKILMPILIGTSTALAAFEQAVAKREAEAEKVKKGDEFAFGEVKFKVLFPAQNFKYNKTSTPELVLLVTFKDKKLLFLGDVSPTIQKSLIPELGKIDILEYAHSAAKSRISPALLGHADPATVVSAKREGTVKLEFR